MEANLWMAPAAPAGPSAGACSARHAEHATVRARCSSQPVDPLRVAGCALRLLLAVVPCPLSPCRPLVGAWETAHHTLRTPVSTNDRAPGPGSPTVKSYRCPAGAAVWPCAHAAVQPCGAHGGRCAACAPVWRLGEPRTPRRQSHHNGHQSRHEECKGHRPLAPIRPRRDSGRHATWPHERGRIDHHGGHRSWKQTPTPTDAEDGDKRRPTRGPRHSRR